MRKIIPYLFAGTLIIVLTKISYNYFRTNSKGENIDKNFEGCDYIEIPTHQKDKNQSAYFYKAKSKKPRPLIISLHTWGGNYKQQDSILSIAKTLNFNYIHPDYGGVQWEPNSCCNIASVQNIEDAITYGVENSMTDKTKIIVIGKSGGGSGVLSAYLNSKYTNAYFMAWSPITNYISWHEEVAKDSILKEKYLEKINLGTSGSIHQFDKKSAMKKSPFFHDFLISRYPTNKKLKLYVGINDGTNGWSTSIMQPILFYNKLISEKKLSDSTTLFSESEIQFYLKNRKPLVDKSLGKVGGRNIHQKKISGQIEFILFDGGHEILYEEVSKQLYSIEEL